MQPAPLLAIDFDTLLPVLFVIFWIVSQVFAVIRRAGQGAAPPPGRPRPVAGPARPAQNVDEARREMARQIEDFLRQASGQERPAQPPARQQQQQRQPPAAPAGRPVAGRERPPRCDCRVPAAVGRRHVPPVGKCRTTRDEVRALAGARGRSRAGGAVERPRACASVFHADQESDRMNALPVAEGERPVRLRAVGSL